MAEENKSEESKAVLFAKLLETLKNPPEEEKGVFHPIVVKYYHNLHSLSVKFLKETNERGFPANEIDILEKHVLPLHQILTAQMNNMIKASQEKLNKGKTR